MATLTADQRSEAARKAAATRRARLAEAQATAQTAADDQAQAAEADARSEAARRAAETRRANLVTDDGDMRIRPPAHTGIVHKPIDKLDHLYTTEHVLASKQGPEYIVDYAACPVGDHRRAHWIIEPMPNISTRCICQEATA